MKIDNQSFRIIHLESGTQQIMTPKAVESCMHPGEFFITPIVYEEDDENIYFSCETQKLVIDKEDVKNGKVDIKREEFKPEIIRKKNGCQPCTNCGRCSW